VGGGGWIEVRFSREAGDLRGGVSGAKTSTARTEQQEGEARGEVGFEVVDGWWMRDEKRMLLSS